MAKVKPRNTAPLRMVGRRGGRPRRLDRLRQRAEPGRAGQDRAVPQLRHGRLAEPRLLHLRRRQLRRRRRAGRARPGRPRSRRRSSATSQRRRAVQGHRLQRPVRLRPVHRQRHPGGRAVHRRGGHQDGRRRQRSGAAPRASSTTRATTSPATRSPTTTTTRCDVNSDAIAYATLQYAMSTHGRQRRQGQGQLQAAAARGAAGAVTAPPSNGPVGPPAGPFAFRDRAGRSR